MARSCGYDRYGNYVCRNSAWNNWIRYVVIAIVVLGIFLLFLFCSCLTARRRRKAGRQPFYGTGWASRPGQGGVQQNVQPYYNNQHNAPAPPYSQQPNQPQYAANAGYYGQQPYAQQNGVELQQPQPTYGRGGDDVYAPPAGPPPGKY
ncbi:hypothetical protein K504DRAFT_475400 [Pleomassaria siparia CBS 279.74]|uniref:Chitin synthesis regulation, congo red resistance, RCR protein n=1 Tax=Pleomassaria siparia CBS 279.74 TaxID=1314801 RepID=A0A6G1KG41_9PLEO|nr:hypothetical protein K504DRAFT_475400 [Pleomassaria siparia CBS 279.74]